MERGYEIVYITLGDLNEEHNKEILKKILTKIEELKGNVISSKLWLKDRQFCSSIKSKEATRKKYLKGSYWFIHFKLHIDELPKLKETFRLEERILRYLFIREKEKKNKIVENVGGEND